LRQAEIRGSFQNKVHFLRGKGHFWVGGLTPAMQRFRYIFEEKIPTEPEEIKLRALRKDMASIALD
jgi:hypothetical protein